MEAGDLVHVRAEQDNSSVAEVQEVRGVAARQRWVDAAVMHMDGWWCVWRVEDGGDGMHFRAEQDDSSKAELTQTGKVLEVKCRLGCMCQHASKQ